MQSRDLLAKEAGLGWTRSIPPFSALRAFEAVGRLGGVRRAAAELTLDHTVVSRHIRLIEQWLGKPLFDRHHGRLVLSDIGAAYHAKVSVALFDLASATIAITGDRDRRELTLWCVPGFAAQWLSARLSKFERLHHGFLIELRPTDATANLAAHEADIDIRYYGDSWPPIPGGKGLRSVELARPPLMIVASPDLAASLSGMTEPSELLHQTLLHEEHHEQWRMWLSKNGVALPDRLPGPMLWHAHLAIAAAKRGDGLALANPYLVKPDLADGSLVEFTPPGCQKQTIGAYYLVAREDRWSLSSIAKLRLFLLAEAQNDAG